MLIEAAGGHALVAYDGPAAIALAERRHLDVILLDIGMPAMDGYETCRELRKVLRKGVAIIALTGWGQEEDKRRALDAGFDAHLTKPADPEKLAELIDKLRYRPA
jgi:hypothetical protein